MADPELEDEVDSEGDEVPKKKRLEEAESEVSELKAEIDAEAEEAAEEIAESDPEDVEEVEDKAEKEAKDIAKGVKAEGHQMSEAEQDALADSIAAKAVEKLDALQKERQPKPVRVRERDKPPKPTHWSERRIGGRRK